MKISSLQLQPGKWELKLHFYPKLNLTSNVNSFFLAKSQFMRSSEGIKEKLPIKNKEGVVKDYAPCGRVIRLG
jgi:hypothetical protein